MFSVSLIGADFFTLAYCNFAFTMMFFSSAFPPLLGWVGVGVVKPIGAMQGCSQPLYSPSLADQGRAQDGGDPAGVCASGEAREAPGAGAGEDRHHQAGHQGGAPHARAGHPAAGTPRGAEANIISEGGKTSTEGYEFLASLISGLFELPMKKHGVF